MSRAAQRLCILFCLLNKKLGKTKICKKPLGIISEAFLFSRCRSVGRLRALGAWGRRFESCHLDGNGVEAQEDVQELCKLQVVGSRPTFST